MNTPSDPFTIHAVGRFAIQLDQLVDRAVERGLTSLLGEVLRQTIEHLRDNPRDWGDPYTNYRGLRAVGYGKTIVEAGIRVEYAVHDNERIVWLAGIRSLPNSPFA